MRRGEPGEHVEIVVGAQPVAQPLRLADPQLAQARPQRLDQLHLVTVLHHALAQLVQRVAVGVKDQSAGSARRARP